MTALPKETAKQIGRRIFEGRPAEPMFTPTRKREGDVVISSIGVRWSDGERSVA